MGDELNMSGHPSNGATVFASADFEDAEESRPPSAFLEAFGGGGAAIQGIVSQALSLHLASRSEGMGLPRVPVHHGSNWRKRLREMMMKQNESILSFLLKPAAEHAILGPVEAALRRYAIRHDVDPNAVVTVRQLCSDISGAVSIQEEIEFCVKQHGPSTSQEIREQVDALLELYKTTGEQVLECENQLRMRLEKMDCIQHRVTLVMELQTNEALPTLTNSLEKYLEVAFRDLGIEAQYKQMLFMYQKHITLRETIQLFRTGSQIQAEPLCPICLTDSVSTAIVPCGHTFCGGCSRRMVMECYVCRGKIRERVKLFFG